MTFPEFTPVTEQAADKRDPSEFVPWRRCVETAQRPGKLLIVRPLHAVEDTRPLRDGEDPNKWRGKLILADVALLDPIPMIPDDGMGNELPGFAAGTIFRNNTILLGYLNKAFLPFVGKTCIGTVYTQAPKQQGFQPSIHWRDLAGDANAVQRGRSFLQAFPDFLIPVAAQFTAATPTATAAPAQGWGQAPTSYTQPVSPGPAGGWNQGPDPWAQGAAQPVAPAQAAPAQHPGQGLSTIDQLKLAATQNQQLMGQPQDPPF